MLIFCALIYQLPATAISQIGASYGMFSEGSFYDYRLKFSAAVLGISGVNLLINHSYIFKNKFFLLYIVFVLYILGIVWINKDVYGFETPADIESISALEFYLPILFMFVLFFIIGLYLPKLLKYPSIMLIASLILACMILINVDYEILGLNRKDYVDPKFYGNYLFIGDATSITALISIAFIRNEKFKIAFAIFSAIAIFFVGSRTSFAVFTSSVALYYIVTFKPKYILVSILCALAATIFIKSYDFTELEARNSRMFGVLLDFENDDSVLGRQNLSSYGWEDISNNIIMGSFGGQLNSLGPGVKTSWRNYMHDIFSYWRQFGLIAFGLILVFILRFYNALLKNLEIRNKPIFSLYFLLGTFLIIESLFSRSFAFGYFHLFFGLTVAINYTMSTNKQSSSYSSQYYKLKSHYMPIKRRSKNKKRKRRNKNIHF